MLARARSNFNEAYPSLLHHDILHQPVPRIENHLNTTNFLNENESLGLGPRGSGMIRLTSASMYGVLKRDTGRLAEGKSRGLWAKGVLQSLPQVPGARLAWILNKYPSMDSE